MSPSEDSLQARMLKVNCIHFPSPDLLAGAASGAHRRGEDQNALGGDPPDRAAASSW